VKTANLTPWCNLYSTASKYNLTLRASRYQQALYAFLAFSVCLILLISFTYHYLIALFCTTFAIITFSVYLSFENNNKVIGNILLAADGAIQIDASLLDYQLMPTSRSSFFGCWLELTPKVTPMTSPQQINNTHPKRIFLFRDAFSQQDYARLTRVIKRLY